MKHLASSTTSKIILIILFSISSFAATTDNSSTKNPDMSEELSSEQDREAKKQIEKARQQVQTAKKVVAARSSEKDEKTSGKNKDSSDNILETKLSGKKLESEIEKRKVNIYKNKLPGGIFNAPNLLQTINQIVTRFQNTQLVDKSIRFELVLASTPVMNAWVMQEHGIKDIKMYYVTVTKGFFDLISDTEISRKILGEERSRKLVAKGESLLAAVIAHEFGHVVNGDLEKGTVTTRVYNELDADYFGARLLAEAGYDPTAMIDLLEMFEVLHKDPSIRELIMTMLDEHPKARFRVANIVDLVETLKNRDKAREKFGFDPSKLVAVPDRPLKRVYENEKASKTSVDGVNRSLSRESYQKLSYREKLQALSNFFSIRSTTEDGMARKSMVRIVEEYKALLNQVNTLEEIKLLIISLSEFEAKHKMFAKAAGKDNDSNVKLHLREIKKTITDKQVAILIQQFPEGLTFENFEEWAAHIDHRELISRLIKKINQANDLDEIKTIIFTKNDAIFILGEKLARYSDAYKYQFLQAAVRRALELTGDVDATFDFLIKNMSVTKTNENGTTRYSIPSQEYLFSEILNLIFEGGQYKTDAFLKKLEHPQTATDKVLASIVLNSKRETSNVWLKSRNLLENGSPADFEFSYGGGLKRRLKKNISTEELVLAHRFLTTSAFDSLINELAGARYTLGQTLDLLIQSRVGNSGDWDQLKREMTEARDNQTGLDLRSQIRTIVSYLVETGKVTDPEFLNSKWKLDQLNKSENPLIRALAQFSTQTKKLHEQRVIALYTQIGKTPSYSHAASNTTDEQKIGIGYTQLSKVNLSQMSFEARYDLYLAMATESQIRKLKTLSIPTETLRKELSDGLDELISEKRFSEEAKNEFLGIFEKYFLKIDKIKSGQLSEMDVEFFKQQRQLRLIYSIFIEPQVNLSTKVREEIMSEFSLSINNEKRFTSEYESKRIVAEFMVGDPDKVRNYLQNPSPETESLVSIDFARKVALLIGKFEGFGLFDTDKDFLGMSLNRTLGQNVYARSEKPMSVRYDSSDDRYEYANPRISPVVGLTDQEKAQIFPLSDHFLKIIDQAGVRAGDRFTTQKLLERHLRDVWMYSLYRATTESDPLHSLAYSLGFSDVLNTSEVKNRLFYLLTTRSLSRVENKEQMEVFVSLFALFLKANASGQHIINEDFFKLKPEDLMKLTPYRYREFFFDYLAKQIDKHNAFEGQRTKGETITNRFLSKVLIYFHYKLTQYQEGGNSVKAPYIFRIWFLKDTLFPLMVKQSWYINFFEYLKTYVAHAYSKVLFSRGLNPGDISTEKLFENVKDSTLWTKMFDEAIARYIYAGDFEKESWWRQGDQRERAIKLIKLIRSLTVRTEVYKFILKKYDVHRDGFVQKIKNYWELYLAYKSAEAIWTKKVLKGLENSNSIIEAWKIKEKAWEDHVKVRAAEAGKTKVECDKLLLDLYNARKKVESPAAAEVSQIFIEASKHRDQFIEKLVKNMDTNFEQIKIQESFKSYNSESPYHKMAKAFFELIDEYITKLEPVERADVALYVSGAKAELMPSTAEKIKKYFKGRQNRKRAVSKTNAYLTLFDMRYFFSETDPEEKLIALRGLMISGIIGNAAAENSIIDPLLMADKDMPQYLRKLLRIYLKTINDNERSIFLSWLLANYGKEPLKGPEIVKLLVDKGGVVAAKLAQIIASHGFDLPDEYRGVLEKFKGDAQKIDKRLAMKWIKERLPEDKFNQIDSIGRQLGSGSFKIGYVATLKDKRKVVIMLPREYVLEKTMREFETTRNVLNEVMSDPELRRDNLPVIQAEVERIIREEMKIKNEYKYMTEHKSAYLDRPLLVRLFGNQVRVMIPQPLEGWNNERILVEEYVNAKGWGDLPDTSFFGWNKRDLAKSSINEVMNQLLSYMNPDELVARDSKVIIDIDPHEENQITKRGILGLKGPMVNIDLGQSVSIDPQIVRGLVQMISFIHVGKVEEAVKMSHQYMLYKNESEFLRFKSTLMENSKIIKDPFETLTKTFETVEMEGITLKPEYLFFQKLFATLVGLKRHVGDEEYLMKQAQKILFLRAISNPGKFVSEVKEGIRELRKLSQERENTKQPLCIGLFQ